MATINLLPNADVSNNWTLSSLDNVYALMSDDHSGSVASDTNYLLATSTGKIFELDFQNFTEAHSSIDSVQAVTRTGNSGRGQSYEIEMTINEGASGAFWAAESSGTITAHFNYKTHTFTNRTTSDGSSAWTNTDIDNLRMKVEITAHSGGSTHATYCYFIVTYTEPLYNSIFFGCNF